MAESSDLQGKLFYYTEETQKAGKRENSFPFSLHDQTDVTKCKMDITIASLWWKTFDSLL